MGFGDFLDKALDKAGSKISNVSGMTSKLDSFKSNFTTYANAKLPTGIGAFGMAMAGGETSSITSGIPSLDLEIAEEAGGLFDTVSEGIGDLIGDEYTEAFEDGVSAAGGIGNVMETAGGLTENFSTMGQGLAAEGFQTLGDMAQEYAVAKADSKINLTNMKKMFGLTGADMRAMAGGSAPDSLIDKIAGRMEQVDYVTSIPIDMSLGLPSVGDFVNEKYPTLAENMPDMGAAVTDNLPTVSDPVRDIVSVVGDNIAAIPDINRFGDVMGNSVSDTVQYIEQSMAKVDNILASGSARSQTDFFGELPDTTELTAKMLPGIQSKMATGIPNPPTVNNAITTEMPNLSPQIETIVADLSTTIDGVAGYSGTSVAMIDASMPYINTVLETTALDLQRDSATGEFPSTQQIITGALPTITTILTGNIPGLPAVKTVVDNTTNSVSGNIIIAVNQLVIDINAIPDIGDVFGIYEVEFKDASFIAVNNVLRSEMGDLSNIEVPELITVMQPLIVNDVYAQIPIPPTVGSTVTTLTNTISDFADAFLLDITPELNAADIEIDAVENTIGEIETATGASTVSMAPVIDTSYVQLQDDYDFVDQLVETIGNIIQDSVPTLDEAINFAMPIIQGELPNVTAYLDDVAGDLMNSFRANIPAIPFGAQAGLGNLINIAQGLATQNFGNLTDAAVGMLGSVNLPITIPDIGSMQIATAMKTTFFNIESIQKSQYGLDMMDKAQEMIPEIDAAMAAYENFSWEGSGFSLGAIGDYLSDITSTDEMDSIVASALEGAPPIQQCSAKMAGALSSAKNAQSTIASKKAEAEAAIDTIKEIFDFF